MNWLNLCIRNIHFFSFLSHPIYTHLWLAVADPSMLQELANKFPLLGTWVWEQGTSNMLQFNHKMRQSWAGSAVSVTSSRRERRDCPGGPVIKTPHFQCREHSWIPCWGAKIPRAVRQKKKEEIFKAVSSLFLPKEQVLPRIVLLTSQKALNCSDKTVKKIT